MQVFSGARRLLSAGCCLILAVGTALATSGCGAAQTHAPSAVSAPTAPWTRVIVTFHVAETSNAEERAVAIVNGREALLQTIPAATYRVVRAYATVAAVVLEVSASALKALEKSPRVVSIEKDSPDAPQ